MRLGRYEIEAPIGQGGMGVVFRARDSEGRAVAIKLLRQVGSADHAARFERERRILEGLGEAEGFVPLIDAGSAAEGPWIAMPFFPGGTLRARLLDGKPLPVDEALDLARTLARTLARAHERGIVHRDLKPENVLFGADGRPYVADLGLAKHFRVDVQGASQSVQLSRTGELRGTAGYAPLEQMRDARAVGPSADVFALGAILYECLAGRPALEAESLVALYARLDDGSIAPIGRSDVPRWLERVVGKALEKDPQARHVDALAFLRALEPPAKKRGAGRLALGAVALAMLIGAGAWALRAKGPPPVDALPQTRSFRATKRTRLVAVLGSWAGKHADMVQDLALAPDERSLVTCGLDGTVKRWDAATGDELETLLQLPEPIDRARPVDERRVVCVAHSDLVRLVEGGARAPLWTVDAPQAVLRTVAVSHRGGLIAVTVSTRGLEVLARDTGKLVAKVRTDEEQRARTVLDLAFAPDDRSVVVLEERRLEQFDLATGRVLRSVAIPETRDGVLSPDAQMALLSQSDGTCLVDATTGALRRLESPDLLFALALSPDRRLAATVTPAAQIGIWDLSSPRPSPRFVGDHKAAITAARFTRDGTFLATACADHAVRMIDLATGRERWSVPGSRCSVRSIAWSPSGDRIAAGTFDAGVEVWSVRTSERLARHVVANWVTNALAWADESKVLSTCDDGSLTLTDVATGKTIRRIVPTVHAPGRSVSVEAAGRIALSAGEDRVLHKWDLATGNLVESALGHEGGNVRALLRPDGREMVSVADDGKCKVWPASGETRQVRTGQPIHAFAVAWGPRLAVLGFDDGTAGTWSLDDRSFDAKVRPFARTATRSIVAAAASPTAPLAATASVDGTLRLHDLVTGATLDEIDLSSSTDVASALAFSPDGRSLAVGTERGVVLVFALQ